MQDFFEVGKNFFKKSRRLRGLINGANQFIAFVRQNGGKLSKAKRAFFAELMDDEVSALEQAIASRLDKSTNELRSE